MTRARNVAGFSTITTTPSPVHVGPIGVLTATRIDGAFNLVDLDTRDITAQGIGVTNLQVSGITTGLNVSGIITAQNGINFNGTSTGLNVSGVGTIATLSVTGNATIAGVLTYEDVTRVDSVGVVTARGLSIFGNTSGLSATGVSTFAGNVLPSSDSSIDIGTNAVRFQNVYADTLYGDGSNLTGITQTTINNNAANRVVTGSASANTVDAEPNLTYDGSVLQVATDANMEGIKIVSSGDTYNDLILSANRSGANNHIGRLLGQWNNGNAASIVFNTGGDTSSKDDGEILFQTSNGGSSLSTRMIIEQDGKIGIGTASVQAYKVEIWDDTTATLMIRKGSTSRIVFSNDSTANTLYSQTISGYAGRDFAVRIGQTEQLRIRADGDINIQESVNVVGIATFKGKVGLDTTGALKLPRGTTSERPSDASTNTPYIRWNSTNSALEVYTGNNWVEIITDYFPNGSTTFN